MSSYDQMFRTEAAGPPPNTAYDIRAKFPYIYFGDCEEGTHPAYANNSLEGLEFDQATLSTGLVNIPEPVFMNYKYMDADASSAFNISEAVIADNLCTITVTATVENILSVGDIVSINGIGWDITRPFINGTWVIYSIDVSDYLSFTFEIKAPDADYSTGTPVADLASAGTVSKGFVFQIADYRAATDARGKSFTSTLFTMKSIYEVPAAFDRILPSDLYTRFRFQTNSDVDPQGGINSNLFNVFDDAGNNIKPVLWAYFFGYMDETETAVTHFELAFNSYAVVLRPSGIGSNLEFAIVKFNWGLFGTDWMTSIVGTDYFKKYDTDVFSSGSLGYLVATNPEVGKATNFTAVTELAKSDSFTYDAEFPVKLNLKIAIRKHLLSDSELDGTYLVNLMINDSYDLFGPGVHYDSILHAYFSKPSPAIWPVNGDGRVSDSMLMPMMYFKFNNINQENVGDATALLPGSSKIVQDSLFFRQLNSNNVNLY